MSSSVTFPSGSAAVTATLPIVASAGNVSLTTGVVNITGILGNVGSVPGQPVGNSFNSAFNFCGNTTDSAATNTDSGITLQNWAISRSNSGSSYFIAVSRGADAGSGLSSYSDVVGVAFNHVPANRILSLIPANAQIDLNRDTTYNKGFAVCSPGLPALGDNGNYSLLYLDLKNKLTRIPKWVAGVYQPDDTAYTFTVSGITNAPHQGDIYTNNSVEFTIISTNLSGGAGTMVATSQTGAPTSSGTLTRAYQSGATSDATITFSSRVSSGVWADAFSVNPANGNTTALGTLTVGGILFAGSGVSQMTLANGKINVAGIDATTAATLLAVNLALNNVAGNVAFGTGQISLDLGSNGTGFDYHKTQNGGGMTCLMGGAQGAPLLAMCTAGGGFSSGVTPNIGIGPNVEDGRTWGWSTVTIQGSIQLPLVTKTSSYSLTALDHTVVFNGTSLTATLPSPSSSPAGIVGRIHRIKNINVSALTVATAAGSITGATTLAVNTFATYQSDGTNWQQIG